ncbi:MAG TPA: S9 family peptidase [Cyclobacteriaceae bacterium]|nr:S9 family peptidase [Cyclobacteriaceae bacterium]HPW60892.1 S9 family peptidase [Cyclobacteriaceae bacterium]
MKKIYLVPLLFLALNVVAQRPITPSDIYKIRSVSDPQVSPDGRWVAYVLSTPDSVKDKSDSDIWMISWDGKESVKLTASKEGESKPRWTPDGKYLTFLSSRYETKKSQIWRMDRRGGEAEKLTDLKYSISEYVWSPDSKKIALIIKDQESKDEEEKKDKTAKPIMIDRYHFKADGDGYLERKRNHLYVFDAETKKLDTLTKGDYDESSPIWSPDSKKIAFVSNRTADPDRNGNSDLWAMDAKKGSPLKQLTTWADTDNSPAWSPDGKWIAYLKSQTPEYDIYDQGQIAVIPAEGGTPKILNATLDRDVSAPRWAADNKSVWVTVEDDRRSHVTSFDLEGKMKVITSGDRVFNSLQGGAGDTWVTLSSDPMTPNEIYVIENGAARRLTHIHDEFLKSVRLASVEAFDSKSKDGTTVGNFLFWPAGKPKDQKLPMIFWIHGGPTSQDDFSFDLIPQILAAQGYAVATVNYRGSNGRGLAFSKAISGDWGNKEVVDILGAVDHLIKTGKADPNKLGIGGWSYGGILTDYVTATDPRFKVAASGAGSAMQLSMYGTDQYTIQYETELGVPWKNMDKWMKVSYPFLNVEKIKTPTLYMVGEEDFNVPAAGSEQMYQALKSLGVPTQFVVYPGQNHGLAVPSYQKDRYTRYLDWFNKYLNSEKLNEKLPPKK